jgi:hypothetical protein
MMGITLAKSEPQKKLYCYYCSACETVLRISREYEQPNFIIEKFDNMCPVCNARLEKSLSGKLLAKEAQPNYRVETKFAPKKNYNENLFVKASSLSSLRLGIKKIDSLIHYMRNDWILCIEGKYSKIIAEMMCVRAQLPRSKGGLDSHVIFIDGGNSSDVYLTAKYSRMFCLDTENVLRRIISSRVFTIYQLAELICYDVPKLVKDYASNIVIINDILGTFNEPELSYREASRVLKAVRDCINRIRKNDLFFLITIPSSSKYNWIVESFSDVVVRMEKKRSSILCSLVKHPFRQNGSITMFEDDFYDTGVENGENNTILQNC